MYLVRGSADFDETSLRQGDILAGIPFPLFEHSKTQVLGAVAGEYDYTRLPPLTPRTHQHRQDAEWVTIQVPARFGMCVVLSNCCDLELRGGQIQTHAVTLARLRPISPDIRNDADRFASLIANRDPRDEENPGYIDFFYLEPHAALQGQDWSVHFNQVVTLPTTDMNWLLRRKIVQIDDNMRVRLKIKLAYSLGRINEDETRAGLENPWQAQPQQPPQQPQVPDPPPEPAANV